MGGRGGGWIRTIHMCPPSVWLAGKCAESCLFVLVLCRLCNAHVREDARLSLPSWFQCLCSGGWGPCTCMYVYQSFIHVGTSLVPRLSLRANEKSKGKGRASLRSIKSSLSFSLPLRHSCDQLSQALSHFSVLQEPGYVGTTTSQLQRTNWLSDIFLHLVFDKAMNTKHGTIIGEERGSNPRNTPWATYTV